MERAYGGDSRLASCGSRPAQLAAGASAMASMLVEVDEVDPGTQSGWSVVAADGAHRPRRSTRHPGRPPGREAHTPCWPRMLVHADRRVVGYKSGTTGLGFRLLLKFFELRTAPDRGREG